LLCLDEASGELVWALSKPDWSSSYLVGHSARHLFLGGDALLCIELRSGLLLWEIDVPESGWTGRGLVSGDLVALPGTGCVYWLDTSLAERVWRRAALPPFSIGTAPLDGPVNLFAHGPYLMACAESGIEVFAALAALRELAQATVDPRERADLLVQAGELRAALDLLGELSTDPALAPEQRRALVRRALALVRDVVLQLAAEEARGEALALLDRARQWIASQDLLLQWQLLRIELFQALRDAAGAAREQEALYRMIEGPR
jgi:hypothetical protein